MSNGHVCCLLGVCCPPEAQIEDLAKLLHEAGRAAVVSGATVAATKFGEATRTFIEWADLEEPAREGRRIQARYILGKVDLAPKGATEAFLALYRFEIDAQEYAAKMELLYGPALSERPRG